MATTNKVQLPEDQINVPGFLRISKIVVWSLYFFIILGIISLILRVLLLLFSANPNAGFAELVATISNDYMQPFRGIFPTREVGETGYLDVSALFAIVVYLFLMWGANALIEYVQGKIDTSKAEQMARIRKAEQMAAQAAKKKPAAKPKA